MNKKHYVIYFDEKTNIAITKTSREWAIEHPDIFPVFNNRRPISNEIDHYLVDKLGFTVMSDDEKFVCFKLTR